MDDKVMSTNTDPFIASVNLQNHLILTGIKTRRFKVNQAKSAHTIFTLKRAQCLDVNLYGTQITQSRTVMYLSLTLNRLLTWAPHIQAKKIRIKHMYPYVQDINF